MSSIVEIIAAKYSTADLTPFVGNVELVDYGSGPNPSGLTGLHITRWGLPDPQPTIEKLEKWAEDNPDKLVPQPTKKEKAIANLKALKGKNVSQDELIDAVVAVIED